VEIMAALVVEDAVRRVYLDYCDIIDEKRFDDLDQVFTLDCVGDYRDTQGVVVNGLAPLVASLHKNMGPESTCGGTHHNVLNFRIDVTAPDRVDAQVHFYAVHRGVGVMAGALYTVWGRYEDELRLTDAGWRVARRAYRNYVVDGDKAVIRRGESQPAGSAG
jgi:hypothetical protein